MVPRARKAALSSKLVWRWPCILVWCIMHRDRYPSKLKHTKGPAYRFRTDADLYTSRHDQSRALDLLWRIRGGPRRIVASLLPIQVRQRTAAQRRPPPPRYSVTRSAAARRLRRRRCDCFVLRLILLREDDSLPIRHHVAGGCGCPVAVPWGLWTPVTRTNRQAA